MRRIGYIRVSTKDQNPDRQIAALENYGISRRNIYLDKMSGKDFARPAYMKMMAKAKKGDVIVIKSIDRLGRDYGEILEQWRYITREKHVDIEVIDMPLLNTNTYHDSLTGIFVSDLVLQILAYVAETERSFIKQRQAEGIAVAREKGVRFGREKAEMPHEFKEYYLLWKEGKTSVRVAADKLGISAATFYRRCKEAD